MIKMSEYLQSELPAIELLKQLGYAYLDAKGEMYETLKQGLMQKLLSGEVRVNQPTNSLI
jgi:hypothetical protein